MRSDEMAVKRNPDIQYINPCVQPVELPDYKGETHTLNMPDTINIQEMAELAINALTALTDPENDYEIYWQVIYAICPPVMQHSESDICEQKFMEALPLMRTITGNLSNLEVEARWMEIILQMQGEDGMLYIPKIGRPWCKFGAYGTEPPGDYYYAYSLAGRSVNAATIYYQLTGEERWKQLGDRFVEGVDCYITQTDDKAYFEWHEYGTEGRFSAGGKPEDRVHNMATYHCWLLQGLSNFYRVTGNEKALKLARKNAKWMMEDSGHFGPDGEFLEEYPGVKHAHFHGHTMVLLGLMDYYLASGDKTALEFVKRGFEYGMANGECTLGFFPEWLKFEQAQTSEACELAEMVALGLKLSAAGAGDYYDMADNWIRNLFIESQVKNTIHFHWLGAKQCRPATGDPFIFPPYHCTDNVVERSVGAFLGWVMPNEGVANYPINTQYLDPGIMNCCTGNGIRAIYYIWEHIAVKKDDCIDINLLYNHVTDELEILSHIPYNGRVDINVKQDIAVNIRLPKWTDGNTVVFTVNGKEQTVNIENGYLVAGICRSGDKLSVSFDLPVTTHLIYADHRGYRLMLKGNTCVAIDPPGKNVPLFQRAHYIPDETRWKTGQWFVPDRKIFW